MTPKEFLKSYVEKFNAKNVSSLLDMYETDACFQVQPGQDVKGLENIRQSLRGFIDRNGNLQSNVKGVIQASNLVLVNTEWLFSGTGPDGKPFNVGGKATDVLRQQSDGTWRIVIDNPWGLDI
ncbi:MAG TPA: nuclear transport factor 2 family protein [Nitrososphaeraceae archaeon]|nr:nuclear transport factor 2 family protein [Nitrososphaeraceae archaeon]